MQKSDSCFVFLLFIYCSFQMVKQRKIFFFYKTFTVYKLIVLPKETSNRQEKATSVITFKTVQKWL